MSDDTVPQDGQAGQDGGWPGPSGAPDQTDVTTTAASASEPAQDADQVDPPATTGTGPPPRDEPAPELSTLLESVLLVADQPAAAVTLAQVVEVPTEVVEATLSRLSQEYGARGSGVDLRQVAGGWRFYTRTECAPWVERFVRDGQQARLTQAALETLAVVAYRQPVTRARVSAVRGVNVDGVVRTLLARGLLAEAGADAETGGTLYVTTALLLEKLGINSLEELPSLAPLLPELDEFEQDSMST
jgi:segregation and condensation protein B